MGCKASPNERRLENNETMRLIRKFILKQYEQKQKHKNFCNQNNIYTSFDQNYFIINKSLFEKFTQKIKYKEIINILDERKYDLLEDEIHKIDKEDDSKINNLIRQSISPQNFNNNTIYNELISEESQVQFITNNNTYDFADNEKIEYPINFEIIYDDSIFQLCPSLDKIYYELIIGKGYYIIHKSQSFIYYFYNENLEINCIYIYNKKNDLNLTYIIDNYIKKKIKITNNDEEIIYIKNNKNKDENKGEEIEEDELDNEENNRVSSENLKIRTIKSIKPIKIGI